MQLLTHLNPRRRTGLIVLSLIALTCLAFWPLRNADFMSVDDPDYVSDNPTVQAGLTSAGFRWAFAGGHVANYHPITWLSHMLDCQIFGLNPTGPHLVNLFIHTLNVVLLFLILRRMTGREGCSAFVAFLFAVHPQHVESVAWIAERKDVLSGLFWMLSLGAYAWYVEAPSWRRYALLLLAFAMGLLSKPMVVTLPCALLLLDYWPLKRPVRFVHLIVEKIPLFLLAGVASIVTMKAQTQGGAVVPLEYMPLSMRVGNAVVSYLRYLKQFALPTDLAAFYPLTRVWPLLMVLAAGGAIVAVSGVVILMRRQRPYLGVGWFWFLGTMIPVIGLVHVGSQSMADRYMYLPMIGLGIAIAWLASDLLNRWPRALAGVACAAILACAVITHTDAGYWENGERLYTRAMERTEPNPFAWHNIAAGMVKRGAYDDAVTVIAKAIEMQPNNAHLHRLYGYTLREAKRLDQAERELKLSLRLNPTYARTWSELGQVYLEQKRWRDAAGALRHAIELRPDDYNSYINLAVAQRMSDDPAAALSTLKIASTLRPLSPKPWYMLGSLLLEMGQPAAAVEPLRKTVAICPSDPDGQFKLGLALLGCGRGADAAGPLLITVQLSPNSAEPMTRLAWLLATHPDAKLRSGSDALLLASRANVLTKESSPDVLNVLAAAQAEQCQFDQAAATAAKAAKLAREAKNHALAIQIEARVQRYQARHAVRDEALAGGDIGEAIP